jgi:alkylated DNA repair protein alkB homolog 6
LNIFPKQDKSLPHRVLQEPRSLLITTGDIYTEYLHSISETCVDENLGESTVVNWPLLQNPESWHGTVPREIRTSLTFRDVIKVVKLKFKR